MWLSQQKTFKINKYPICCCWSEISNLSCFFCARLTLYTWVSGSWRCVWIAWQVFSNRVDFSNLFCWMHLFCVLLWAKLLWKLLFKGSYQFRIQRENFWKWHWSWVIRNKWNLLGRSESNGEGKGQNSANGGFSMYLELEVRGNVASSEIYVWLCLDMSMYVGMCVCAVCLCVWVLLWGCVEDGKNEAGEIRTLPVSSAVMSVVLALCPY